MDDIGYVVRGNCPENDLAKVNLRPPRTRSQNPTLLVFENVKKPRIAATKVIRDPLKPRRPVGRPRKVLSDNVAKSKDPLKPRRPVGRPKKRGKSKVAYSLEKKQKEEIVDIDSADAKNDLSVKYAEDIYKFYKSVESEWRPRDYMPSQPEINEKMRLILVEWLIDIHVRFELNPETFYLTITILDRFLSVKPIPRNELQLVGLGALLITSKYKEVLPPQVEDLADIAVHAYSHEQILVMEKTILSTLDQYLTVATDNDFLTRFIKACVADQQVEGLADIAIHGHKQILVMVKTIRYRLEWYLTVPTHYVFLARFIKACIADQQMENMVHYLAELSVMHYDTMIRFSPSMVAASAIYAARSALHQIPIWTSSLKHHTGYSETQLMDCAKLMAYQQWKQQQEGNESKGALRKKYSKNERFAVALIPPAKALLTETES